MKPRFLFSFLFCMVLVFECAFAQQDPYDPNEADTLYFSPGGSHSSDGDTLYLPPGSNGGDVIILINFWNDNQIKGFTVPLTDGCYGEPGNTYLDPSKNATITEQGYPICFVGSRVVNKGWTLINLIQNPPDVLYGAVCTTSVDSGRGLFATMVCTVYDTTTICLDTIFFPPENTLKFVLPDGIHSYRPIFRTDMFHVGWRPNTPPNPFSLISPQTDTLADTITLIWNQSTDPDPEDTVKYCAYYSISEIFHPDSTREICDLTDTSCIITDPNFYSVSYWKVKAYDQGGLETWSDQVFTFFAYISGDVNCDGISDIVDVVYKINYVLKGGSAPCILQAADHTCDGEITIADIVCEINYVLKGGPKNCCP